MLSLVEVLGLVGFSGGCAFLAARLIEMIRHHRSFRVAANRRVRGLLLPRAPRLRERL